jgi:hypothetical protein
MSDQLDFDFESPVSIHPSPQPASAHPSPQPALAHPSAQPALAHPSPQPAYAHPSLPSASAHPSLPSAFTHPSLQPPTVYPSLRPLPASAPLPTVSHGFGFFGPISEDHTRRHKRTRNEGSQINVPRIQREASQSGRTRPFASRINTLVETESKKDNFDGFALNEYIDYYQKYHSEHTEHGVCDVNPLENLYKYTNKLLGINIYGMKQPIDINNCLTNLIDNKFKYYITLNDQGSYEEQTREEEQTFKKICNTKLCNFFNVSVEDYKSPTTKQFLQLFKILDEYHNISNPLRFPIDDTQAIDITNIPNLVIHCTGGTGRTGSVILFYIWLRRALIHPSFEPAKILVLINKYLDTNTAFQKILYFNEILAHPIFIYLGKQILTYSFEAYEEIYVSTIRILQQKLNPIHHSTDEDEQVIKIFINRIMNFINAFEKYKQVIFDNNNKYTYLVPLYHVLSRNNPSSINKNSIYYKYQNYIQELINNNEYNEYNFNSSLSQYADERFSFIDTELSRRNNYYLKYIKYKNKYLSLKNSSNI